MQAQFRRWSIFAALNLIALVWLLVGDSQAQTLWNYVWSALAVDVEFVTALALVSLARRDHDTINRIERLEKHILSLMDHHGVEHD